jgi:pimeloyl-ACP methyl ester carboxylesterase
MQQTISKWIGTYINTMAHIAPEYAGKFGFKMFGRPARKRISPEVRRFLDSSEKFSFTHKGIRIKRYRWGTGKKKVLLLHGWQSHSGRWKQMVSGLLSSGYTVYAIDAPAHGLSGGAFFSAPLYGEVILQFGKQTGKFHAIIGHSLGAFSILYVMSQFKQPGADHLVIMAAPGEVRDFVTYFKKRLALSERSLEAIRNHFIREIGRPYEEFSISRFAEHLDLPGLIVHDRKDRFAPYRYAKLLHEKWSDSILYVTDGKGHHLDSPEVKKAVIDFINGDQRMDIKEFENITKVQTNERH